MSGHKISTIWGDIEWYASEMPGCCGVTVLHDIFFRDVIDKFKLYDFLHDTLIFGKEDLDETGRLTQWSDKVCRRDALYNVNKYILTDRKYFENLEDRKPSVYEFCHYIGAHYGTLTYNPNSSNSVQVFELTRPRKKYTLWNGEYVAQTKGVQVPDTHNKPYKIQAVK